MPSKPKSLTPDRLEKVPPVEAKIKGTELRREEDKMVVIKVLTCCHLRGLILPLRASAGFFGAF